MKKRTILKIFTIPLIIVMFIQALIAGASIILSNSIQMLEDYSVSIMNQTVETRRVILENNMIQSWSNVSEAVDQVNLQMTEILNKEQITVKDFLEQDELHNVLLGTMLEHCIYTMQKNVVTGSFIILGNPDGRSDEYQLNGIYFRDSDPFTNSNTYSDVLMERGSSQFSRELNVPLDVNWKTQFHFYNSGVRAEDDFFYKPLNAAKDNQDIGYKDLGNWSLGFCLEGNTQRDSYRMITYTVPLIYEDGTVYGVMGIEISLNHLMNILPAKDLNNDDYSGYILLRSDLEGGLIPVVNTGTIAGRITDSMDLIYRESTEHKNFYKLKDTDADVVYMAGRQLHLYNTNTPFEQEVWILGGVQEHDNIFGLGRNIVFTFGLGLLIALLVSVIIVYFLTRRLTAPIIQLAKRIREDSDIHLKDYNKSEILEIDELYEAVSNLQEIRDENENRINEEKERYKIALQSSTDVLFACDLQSGTVELQNMGSLSDRLETTYTENWEKWVFESEMVHPDYRNKVNELFYYADDTVSDEIKARASIQDPYIWVSFSGNVIYDIYGSRSKLIGNIRNINSEKEAELRELESQRIDSVTGLYKMEIGQQIISERIRQWENGALVLLDIDSFYKLNETYGMIFGDAILEEIGSLINEFKKDIQKRRKSQMVAARAGGDEMLLWMSNISGIEMKEELEGLQEQIKELYADSKIELTISGGISEASKENCDFNQLLVQGKQALAYAKKVVGEKFVIYSRLTEAQLNGLEYTNINEIASVSYRDQLSIVSIAFNFFDKGGEISGILPVLLMKLGRHFNVAAIIMMTVDRDFHTSCMNYRWQEEKNTLPEDKICNFVHEEFEVLVDKFGDGSREAIKLNELTPLERKFFFVKEGDSGISIPMYDNVLYIGALIFISKKEDPHCNEKDLNDLHEVVKLIESNYNKEKHDKASRAKSDFLSRMSHEIRTPMNAIIGMTAIAMTQKESPDKIEESLVKIEQSSKFLLSLINDILDMSKIESGKMKLSYQNFNISQMLDNTITLIQTQASQKSISLKKDISIFNEWLIGDMLHLNQVLINLLSNAVKFTPHDGTITLTVRQTQKSDSKTTVYFSVADTGIGVTAKDKERIFSSFEQGESQSEGNQSGTGLGLAISTHLVNMMGGDIGLESEIGKGSNFFFSIDMKKGGGATLGEKEGDVRFDEEDTKELDGKRVLLVDDNSLNIEIAQTLLELNGLVVETAMNGQEAVDKYQENGAFYYDIILMDIRMPVMNGLEATKKIRRIAQEDAASIPIIAMTANAFDEDMKKSIASGMNGHLSKPVDIKELLRTMKRSIR